MNGDDPKKKKGKWFADFGGFEPTQAQPEGKWFKGFNLPTHVPVEEDPRSLFSYFTGGIGQGLFRPLSIFGIGEEGPAEELTTPQSVAQLAGDFIGMGISFVPFLAGAKVAVGAVQAGKLATTLGIQRALSTRPLITRMVEGAISFGAYEAGASRTVGEIPTRVAGGVALGAAGEAAFYGLGRVWRARFPSKATLAANLKTDPLAEMVERQLSPALAEHPDVLRAKLSSVGEAQDQMLNVATRTLDYLDARDYMFIPTGTESPERFVAALKSQRPDYVFETIKRPEGGYEVFAAKPTFKHYVPATTPEGVRFSIVPKEKPRLSIKQTAAILRTDTVGEKGVNFGFEPLTKDRGQYRPGLPEGIEHVVESWDKSEQASFAYLKKVLVKSGMNQSKASVVLNDIFLKPASERPLGFLDIIRLATTSHEYMHHLTSVLAGADEFAGSFDNGIRVFAKYFTSGTAKTTKAYMESFPSLAKNVRPILAEYMKLVGNPGLKTYELDMGKVLRGDYGVLLKELASTTSWLKKEIGVGGTWESYSGHEGELLSNLADGLVIDPKHMMEIAPNAVNMMEELLNTAGLAEKLSLLLTRGEVKNMHRYLWMAWEKRPREMGTQWMQEVTQQVGQQQVRQVAEEGAFVGMEWYYQGRPYMHVKTLGPRSKASFREPTVAGPRAVPTEGTTLIKSPRTLKVRRVKTSELTRPVLGEFTGRSAIIEGRVQDLLDKMPPWLVLRVFNPQENGVQRAFVDLKDFDQAKSLFEWLKTEKGRASPFGAGERNLNLTMLGSLKPGEAPMTGVMPTPGAPISGLGYQDLQKVALMGPGYSLRIEDVAAEALRQKGKKGLVLLDNGRASILFVDPVDAMKLSSTVRSLGLERYSDTILGERLVHVEHQSYVESTMMAAGAKPHELPALLRQANFARKFEQIADEEFKVAQRRASNAMRNVSVDTKTMATQNNLVAEETTSGGWAVKSFETGTIAKFEGPAAEQQARDLMAQLGPSLDAEIERKLSSMGEVDQLRKMIASAKTEGWAPEVVEGLEQDLAALMNPSASTVGGIRRSMAEADFFASLGIPKGMVKDVKVDIPMIGNQLPTDFVAASAAPGMPPIAGTPLTLPDEGFLNRAINALNNFLATATNMETLSKTFERVGYGPAYTRVFKPVQDAALRVDHEMAGVKRTLLGDKTFNEQLRGIERLAKGMKGDRQKAVTNYIQALSREEIAAPGGLLQRGMTAEELTVANRIAELGLGDDVPKLLSILRSAKTMLKVDPGTYKDLNAVFADLGLTDAEKEVMSFIEMSFAKSKNDFSIYAVSRYAAAEPLRPGFKSGREAFAHDWKLTGEEKQLAAEIDRALDAAFEVGGINKKRYLGGYFPHIRKWMEQGFTADRSAYKDFFQYVIPDEMKWTALRFRTGELSPTIDDPVMATYKHIRSMLMKEHFDPVLEGVKQSLKGIKELNPRAGRILDEYINELIGRPHRQFHKLNEIISNTMDILGVKVSNEAGQHIINNMTALAYGATIPFRVGLIARNYFQCLQMIAPRIGYGDFYGGLTESLTEQGWKAAVKAGVITTNVAPVHATTEVFGFGATAFSRRLQKVVDRGFRWYQKADDLGRAIAYHGMRRRIARYQGELIGGRINFEKFKELAKIKTFDPIDEAMFEDLWMRGKYEEAKDWVASAFSRETIFRYGHANHPAGWGGVYGRLFGQFGTWPIQYKDFLLQGMSRGTTKDRLEFIASHGAINAAIVAAGATAGLNLTSWVAYPSLDYTGGPYADMALDLVRLRQGSPTERRMAWKSLKTLVPTFDDPRSILLPGSYLLGDLKDATEERGAAAQVARALGIRILHPKDKTWLDLLDF